MTGLSKEKVILITGGANGIGLTLVNYFTSKGYNVYILDNDSEKIETMLSIGYSNSFACDICNEDDLINVIDKIYEETGRIDVIINNAGINKFIPITEMKIDEWDSIINTNLRSSFIISREYARRHDNAFKGCIINISSTRAYMSEVNSEAYAASKGGLISLTHALALSLSPLNITVNCVAPGWIHTGAESELTIEDHLQHPSTRVGTPLDVAKACEFLANPENSFINGETLIIDGGMTRKMIYK